MADGPNTNSGSPAPWRIWIDTGGTFTDCLALAPDHADGGLHRAKVLSSAALRGRVIRRIDRHHLHIAENWGACDDLIAGFSLAFLNAAQRDYSGEITRFDARAGIIELSRALPANLAENIMFEARSSEPAPILAARLVTRTPGGSALPPIEMRLGTTRGTNALLERRGAAMALFITEGFGDLLAIGDQQRPDLFALKIEKPPLLYQRVVEVPERLAADGSVLRAIDLEHVAQQARSLLAQGIS